MQTYADLESYLASAIEKLIADCIASGDTPLCAALEKAYGLKRTGGAEGGVFCVAGKAIASQLLVMPLNGRPAYYLDSNDIAAVVLHDGTKLQAGKVKEPRS